MRLIVTRPAAQAGPWVNALQALGLDAQALPLIGIAPPHDLAPVRAAWSGLAHQRLVMFVSANAVEHFFAARPAGALWPAALPAGSTGPGTSAALRGAGGLVHCAERALVGVADAETVAIDQAANAKQPPPRPADSPPLRHPPASRA